MEISIEQISILLGGIFSAVIGTIIKYAWTKTMSSLEKVIVSNALIVTRMAVLENNMGQVSDARQEMKSLVKDIHSLQNQSAKSWSVQDSLEHRINLLEEKIRDKAS